MRATPDVARARPTSARRRRERRIRSFFRHEQMAVKLAVVSAQHHSAQRCCSVDMQTDDEVLASTAASPMVGYAVPAPVPPAPVVEYVAPTPAVTYAAPAPVVGYVAPAPAVTYAAPAPVMDYVAPAPSVTYAAPAPVIDYVAPAPSVTFAAPAPVFEYVEPAPVSEYIVPAPAVFFVAPSQQLRPAYSAAAVTTGVNLDAEFVGSASQVVVSLPHGEVFAVPVFHQVHHGLRAGDDIPVNLVDPPVVPGQGDFLRVVARRPPLLVDVMPSSRFHRHIMEDLGELAPSVQLLDLPVPHMVDQPVDILKIIAMLLPAVDEQVIDVPKIIQDSTPQRLRPPEPQQLVEQLVEVPTVLSFAVLQRRTAEAREEEMEELLAVPSGLRTTAQWARLRELISASSQARRRKRKKRRKRRLPRTSSRLSRCRNLWSFRSCSSSTLLSLSPFVPQTQILMVQSVQKTTEFLQLLYVSGWFLLVTIHLALCSPSSFAGP